MSAVNKQPSTRRLFVIVSKGSLAKHGFNKNQLSRRSISVLPDKCRKQQNVCLTSTRLGGSFGGERGQNISRICMNWYCWEMSTAKDSGQCTMPNF